MAELLSSKMSIEEEAPQLRSIQGVPTAVLMAVGITKKGPLRTPTRITSWDEFVTVFGSDTADSNLVHAIRGFFENGGQQAYISRTVHYTDIADADSATSALATLNLLTAASAPSAGAVTGSVVGPFILPGTGQTLVVTINGGAPATATFTAVAASRLSGAAEPYALTDGWTLTVSIDGGATQTITFATANFAAIGAATAEEVAAVINAGIVGATATVTGGGTTVTITSDRKGTGSGVNVIGGLANGALAFTTGNVAGTGNVSNLVAVTVAEVKTIVELAVAGCTVTNVGGAVRISSNTTGAGSSVLVGASSTADDEMGFDNATHTGGTGAAGNTLRVDAKYHGIYGNDLKVIIAAATSGASEEFNLSVEDDGIVVEVWPNLSMVDSSDRYVETIINAVNTGSTMIAVTDLDSGATSQRPANGTSLNLAGGVDGLTSLADNDFIGDSTEKTGFYAYDTISDGTMLICPDRPTAAVHNVMLTYCEVVQAKRAFAIIDPPANQTAVQIKDYVETTAAILNRSEFGAIYWPQIKVLNPSTELFGTESTIVVPPSGHIAGCYARTDAARDGGVYDPPAGVERGIIAGCLGFETEECLDEKKRDIVYPSRINPLTTEAGLPRYIDGTRTLKGDGNFPSVSERRGVIFIEQSLKRGLTFARHTNNTPKLRATVSRSSRLFLREQTKRGAFRSDDPKTAFFVDFGDGLNPASAQFAGKLIGRIGLATAKPTDFVILRFSQDTRALDSELAGR